MKLIITNLIFRRKTPRLFVKIKSLESWLVLRVHPSTCQGGKNTSWRSATKFLAKSDLKLGRKRKS